MKTNQQYKMGDKVLFKKNHIETVNSNGIIVSVQFAYYTIESSGKNYVVHFSDIISKGWDIWQVSHV